MSNDHENKHAHHLTPFKIYYLVFGALITLTVLTVVTSLFDFGIMNIVVAMLIATIKATLVVMFFMQLKFDDLGNKVTFAAAFAFLFIFIALTASDLFFRVPQKPVQAAEQKVAAGGGADQNK